MTHIADEADARVVFVGDRRQLPAYVEADHHRADDYYLAEVPVADHREGGPGDTEQLREDGNVGVSVGSAAVTSVPPVEPTPRPNTVPFGSSRTVIGLDTQPGCTA